MIKCQKCGRICDLLKIDQCKQRRYVLKVDTHPVYVSSFDADGDNDIIKDYTCNRPINLYI